MCFAVCKDTSYHPRQCTSTVLRPPPASDFFFLSALARSQVAEAAFCELQRTRRADRRRPRDVSLLSWVKSACPACVRCPVCPPSVSYLSKVACDAMSRLSRVSPATFGSLFTGLSAKMTYYKAYIVLESYTLQKALSDACAQVPSPVYSHTISRGTAHHSRHKPKTLGGQTGHHTHAREALFTSR